MKPNAPGEWHARDGRKIVVYNYCGEEMRYRNIDDLYSSHILSLPGDDWLPAVAPTFPELPPKPRLVFAEHAWGSGPQWYVQSGRNFNRVSTAVQDAMPQNLTVAPHPDNDPEAVRIIEEARHAEA